MTVESNIRMTQVVGQNHDQVRWLAHESEIRIECALVARNCESAEDSVACAERDGLVGERRLSVTTHLVRLRET